MFKSISLVMLSLIVLCLGAADMSQAAIRKKKDRPEKPVVIVPHKLSITPWVLGGSLTSESGSRADIGNKGLQNRILFGGGVSVRRSVSPTLGLGVNIGLSWKSIPNVDSGPFRAFSYSASAHLNPYPLSRTAPVFCMELGFSDIRYLNYDGRTIDLDSHFMYSFGVGVLSYTRVGTTISFTLLYRVIQTNGYLAKDAGYYATRFDVTYIGLELGVSFPLKKFPL